MLLEAGLLRVRRDMPSGDSEQGQLTTALINDMLGFLPKNTDHLWRVLLTRDSLCEWAKGRDWGLL